MFCGHISSFMFSYVYLQNSSGKCSSSGVEHVSGLDVL